MENTSEPVRGGFEELLEIARTLRGPGGCPWDRGQDAAGLAGHLVEESYEVLEAAATGDAGRLGEELGDTLFLLALVQACAQEQGGPDASTVARSAVRKIRSRHPHVFGDRPEALDLRTAALDWEQRKREEKAGQAGPASSDPPSGVPEPLPAPAPALPALLQAYRLQEKAAHTGFDWSETEPVILKIEEEIGEVREALAAPGQDLTAVREELGDLLFAVVNLARRLRVDPEQALRGATSKFRVRFNRMADLAAADGTPLHTLGLEQMDRFWEEAKREEEPGSSAG